MKAKNIIWILTAVLMLSVISLTGCGDQSKEAADTKEEVTEKKDETPAEHPEKETKPTEPAEPVKPEPEKKVEVKTMYTTYDLAFRADAKKDSDKIGAVPINTEVKVLDSSKEYYKIKYDGKEGYVLGEYLTEDKAVAEQAAKDAAAAQAAAQQKATGGNNGGGNNGGGNNGGGNNGGNKKECLDGGLIN